jgi:hypothetical protein
MTWTLRQANLLSPDAILNDIVRQLNQMEDTGRLIVGDVFPMVELSDSKETYFTHDGLRTGMDPTALGSESPVGDIEDLGTEDVTVHTYKKKIQADKGADTELNSQQEILNLYEAIVSALREDVVLTRAKAAWQGDANIDGIIGEDGATAHPDLDSSHVVTPGTAYSDTANSTPLTDFLEAEERINQDGGDLGAAGSITAYVTPSELTDLKQNDDLTGKYRDIAALSDEQVAEALQVDRIVTVRTQVPRKDANGNLVDENGNVVEDASNAARDNILEPHDGASNVRNIVIMAPGQETAFMPWFAARLAERASGVDPTGDFAVDMTNGWMSQTWTQPDPAVSWFKVAQEFGFHVRRPGNIVVIQDI